MRAFRIIVHLGGPSAVPNSAAAASSVALLAFSLLLELLLISFCVHTITWLIRQKQAYLFFLDSSILEPDLHLSICKAQISRNLLTFLSCNELVLCVLLFKLASLLF